VTSTAARVLLLASQAFALGLMMAWLLIPASTIFLETYGAGLLPVTYIGAAAAGIAASGGLAAALRRRSLSVVAARTLAGLAIALVVAWAALARADATWVSFALLVLVPIVVPIGFMFLVGQAGMLLDVRALKALYARVIAGFALGFVVGGLVAPLLLDVLAGVEDLLALAAVGAMTFLVLVEATRRRHPEDLAHVVSDDDPAPPSLRLLLSERYLMLIVAFQMLSAVESQWLDYLVLDRAAQRYEDSRDLAEFIGRFTAITYGADILFLLALAGLLLRRFGLRYGLSTNPAGVLTLVTAMVVMASLQGSGATLVFVVVVGARVVDLVLSDGAARNSLSAAYQVVPARLRQAGQARVEGLAVPLAIGLSGVGLLVIRATVGTDGLAFPVLIGSIVAVWLLTAFRVHDGYRASLLDALRYRTLDAAVLPIDDPNSLRLIDQLVDSADARDVRAGLDTLTAAAHPGLPDRLSRLAADHRIEVRTDALERLALVDAQRAATAARPGLDHPSPVVRASSVRVLGVLGAADDLPAIEEHQADPDLGVRAAVAAAMGHLGDDEVTARVSGEVARLARSATPVDRVLAAQILALCDAGDAVDRAPLAGLLADVDADVAVEALAATRCPEDVHLVDGVVQRLHDRATAGAAVEALVRCGGAGLAAADERLGQADGDHPYAELLVRVCRGVGGPAAVAVLERHLAHADREVGLAVLVALGALVTPTAGRADPTSHDLDDALAAVVEADLEHAAAGLRAVTLLDPHEWAAPLCTALRDELDLLRRRALATLSVRHGAEPLRRVTFQLDQHDPRQQALAIEWLEVTLTTADRGLMALIEPSPSDDQRLDLLARWGPLPSTGLEVLLLDLVEDGGERWRQPWLQACALHALAVRAGAGAQWTAGDLDALSARDRDGIVTETISALSARRFLTAASAQSSRVR